MGRDGPAFLAYRISSTSVWTGTLARPRRPRAISPRGLQARSTDAYRQSGGLLRPAESSSCSSSWCGAGMAGEIDGVIGAASIVVSARCSSVRAAWNRYPGHALLRKLQAAVSGEAACRFADASLFHPPPDEMVRRSPGPRTTSRNGSANQRMPGSANPSGRRRSE